MTFVKWITCSVDEGSRGRFSAAQQRWSEIAAQPGLVAQVGGWDRASGDAHILGCWTGKSSYQAFMSGCHDDARKRSGQHGTYQKIEVVTRSSLLAIPGMAAAGGMLGGLFSRLGEDRYLVTTWWSSVQAHHRYATTAVAGLRRRAAADGDIADLRGYALTLQPEWHIQPPVPGSPGQAGATKPDS